MFQQKTLKDWFNLAHYFFQSTYLSTFQKCTILSSSFHMGTYDCMWVRRSKRPEAESIQFMQVSLSSVNWTVNEQNSCSRFVWGRQTNAWTGGDQKVEWGCFCMSPSLPDITEVSRTQPSRPTLISCLAHASLPAALASARQLQAASGGRSAPSTQQHGGPWALSRVGAWTSTPG